MLNTQGFGSELKRLGFDFYAGVPCSFLKSLINYAINECEYVMAANEGDAVAIASGAWLAGRKAVVLMQNSGLTNATSPITSLNFCFHIPVLGFVSLRGEPGVQDEPQHELMGQITGDMLSLMKVKWEYLSGDPSESSTQLRRAAESIAQGQTFFFIVRTETFGGVKLRDQALRPPGMSRAIRTNRPEQRPLRHSALRGIVAAAGSNTILLATTGKTGRELFEIADKPNHLYLVGSMGCVSSMALGLAMAKPDRRVIAIDGDGAALMRLGAMATVAYYRPENLLHILLDNNSHDSTGGQSTVSHIVDFVGLASSMNYPLSVQVADLPGLDEAVRAWEVKGGLTFIHMRIASGSSDNLGRPSVKPREIANRLSKFLRA